MAASPNGTPPPRRSGRAAGTIRASGDLLDEEGGFAAGAITGRAEFSELSVQVEDVPLTAESPLVVTFKPNEVTFERTAGGQATPAASRRAVGRSRRRLPSGVRVLWWWLAIDLSPDACRGADTSGRLRPRRRRPASR